MKKSGKLLVAMAWKSANAVSSATAASGRTGSERRSSATDLLREQQEGRGLQIAQHDVPERRAHRAVHHAMVERERQVDDIRGLQVTVHVVHRPLRHLA